MPAPEWSERPSWLAEVGWLLVGFGGACAVPVLVVSAFVVLGLFGRHPPNYRALTETEASTVHGATEMYLAENPGASCPDMHALVSGAFLHSAQRTTDAWDQPFRIECDGFHVTVRSAGPDGRFGTKDDIVPYGTPLRAKDDIE